MFVHSIKNDTKIWKNPEEFLPERHLNENGNIIKNSAFAPFGGGNIKRLTRFYVDLPHSIRFGLTRIQVNDSALVNKWQK